MTIEEFSKDLARLLEEFFHGMPVGNIPMRMTFQLWEENPDTHAPLRVDLSIRRVWRD